MTDVIQLSYSRWPSSMRYMHLWDMYARRFGFPRALLHPQRVVDECLSRLPCACDHGVPQRLDAWLKGPVPHRTPVRLHATRAPKQTTFALFVERERPCIVGRLQPAADGGR